jgi:hypothetical protein
MHNQRTATWWRALARPAIAAPLAILLFVLGWASASPSLHHWFHCDSQSPTHHCVITVLEHGQSDVVTVAPAVPVPQMEPVAAAPLAEPFFASQDPTLYPERGPPSLS